MYFDLNDFDDALLAPLTVDVVRMLSSLMIAASQLGLSEEDARNASERMLSSYAAVLARGKPRWLERATAQGLVAELLRRVKRRRRGELLAQRTEFRKERRRLRIDGRHALAADKAQRKHAAAILHMYSQLPHGHRPVADDAARRIAGTGSLGTERYVVLAHEVGMPPVAQRLIDVKLAAPTAWSGMRLRRQPRWEGEAARVVQVQQVMQAASPALLAAVKMNGLSYVVKSLQPTADRVDRAVPPAPKSCAGAGHHGPCRCLGAPAQLPAPVGRSDRATAGVRGGHALACCRAAAGAPRLFGLAVAVARFCRRLPACPPGTAQAPLRPAPAPAGAVAAMGRIRHPAMHRVSGDAPLA